MKNLIVVPLDGSELAEQAIPWASLLAKTMGYGVELLRCYHPLDSVFLLTDLIAPESVRESRPLIEEKVDQ
jgi:nucleotide-binding universal stress UspA family protein